MNQEKLTTIYVLCHNDYPHSAYLTKEEAEDLKSEFNVKATKHWHVQQIMLKGEL